MHPELCSGRACQPIVGKPDSQARFDVVVVLAVVCAKWIEQACSTLPRLIVIFDETPHPRVKLRVVGDGPGNGRQS